MKKLNIETSITAVDSQFSNGTVKRHNLIVNEAVEKMLEEKSEPEIAVAWAVSAKNAFQNHSGQSPNELVFGFSINIPTCFD